ncbi:histidinol-phosphatase [Rhodobacterales bacterium 52_120_T64]|nr:histidinol-phosphatase [Rhodobacterales bacterium 52_120_T64]
MFSQNERDELLDVVNALADAARKITLRYFRAPDLQADNKLNDGFDPVTVADREAEMAIREILAKRRPDDAILGEEFGNKAGTSGLTWVIDPIDGTRAFISGIPSWGVLIGLDAGTGPVLGVVDQPYMGERFVGAFGRASLATREGTRDIASSTCETLGDATLMSTFPEVGTATERLGFEAVRDCVKLTRYGLDCYAYALLAMGQIDLVIEAGLNAYDVQGPIGVIQAAGGTVTDWQGGPAHNGGRILAAGNATLHTQALDILSKFAG